MRLYLLLLLTASASAQTRLQAAQVEPWPKPAGRSYLTVRQMGTLAPRQLAGNVRLVRSELAILETGQVIDWPLVVAYPPAWCKPARAWRVCPSDFPK